MTSQDLAVHTGQFPAAHYRLCYDLERQQLVRRISGRPRQFAALPLKTGLTAALQTSENQLENLFQQAIGQAPQATDHTYIIVGRQAVYDEYMRLTEAARRQVCVYAIGIAFSDDLAATQRGLLKRGVGIRHIMQQHKLSNHHVVATWQRLGVKLRHLPGPRGFHFFLIDNQQVCITFSNPEDTEQRLSIVTNNQAAVKLFQAQFFQLWDAANELAG